MKYDTISEFDSATTQASIDAHHAYAVKSEQVLDKLAALEPLKAEVEAAKAASVAAKNAWLDQGWNDSLRATWKALEAKADELSLRYRNARSEATK